MAGAIIRADWPVRKLVGKAAQGWVRSTCTVWASITETDLNIGPTASPDNGAEAASSRLVLTAVASNASPSWKVTPVRRCSVQLS